MAVRGRPRSPPPPRPLEPCPDRSEEDRGSLADDSLGPKPRDGLAPVAEDLAQDRLGVLTQGRGGGRLPYLAFGPDGTGHFPDAPEVRMLHAYDHVAGTDLLVFESLGHAVDGRAGHVAAQQVEPLGCGLFLEARLEDVHQLRLVAEALREAREARVLREPGQL